MVIWSLKMKNRNYNYETMIFVDKQYIFLDIILNYFILICLYNIIIYTDKTIINGKEHYLEWFVMLWYFVDLPASSNFAHSLPQR